MPKESPTISLHFPGGPEKHFPVPSDPLQFLQDQINFLYEIRSPYTRPSEDYVYRTGIAAALSVVLQISEALTATSSRK